MIITKDCIRCHKISGSSRYAQFGGLLFSVDLVLVTDIRYVERRGNKTKKGLNIVELLITYCKLFGPCFVGYLTLCVEAQGLSRTYLRRTDGIREWGKILMECVKRKKDEFERDMSPCDVLRYPR